MNWAALVQNTGPYPEETLFTEIKIVVGLIVTLWLGLMLLRRWAREPKKTSVAERAGLVKKVVRLHLMCHKCAHEGHVDLSARWLLKMFLVTRWGGVRHEGRR